MLILQNSNKRKKFKIIILTFLIAMVIITIIVNILRYRLMNNIWNIIWNNITPIQNRLYLNLPKANKNVCITILKPKICLYEIMYSDRYRYCYCIVEHQRNNWSLDVQSLGLNNISLFSTFICVKMQINSFLAELLWLNCLFSK